MQACQAASWPPGQMPSHRGLQEVPSWDTFNPYHSPGLEPKDPTLHQSLAQSLGQANGQSTIVHQPPPSQEGLCLLPPFSSCEVPAWTLASPHLPPLCAAGWLPVVSSSTSAATWWTRARRGRLPAHSHFWKILSLDLTHQDSPPCLRMHCPAGLGFTGGN